MSQLKDTPRKRRGAGRVTLAGQSSAAANAVMLAQNGLEPGPADGIIGANTRKAVRAFQQSLGQPADGYPSHELLQQLR
mgnify:CR=1 FL=1